MPYSKPQTTSLRERGKDKAIQKLISDTKGPLGKYLYENLKKRNHSKSELLRTICVVFNCHSDVALEMMRFIPADPLPRTSSSWFARDEQVKLGKYLPYRQTTGYKPAVAGVELINKSTQKNIVKFVDNYKITSTGKIADIISPEGNNIGSLYKQSKGEKLFYSFKYKTSSGNIKTLDKLEAEIYDDFIEFNFNVPNELKGQGISSVVFDDAVKYYNVKNINYKGIRGRWEGADPMYADGMSDNFKSFKEARMNKVGEQAAFETWTGKQAQRIGFTEAKVITEEDTLILIEFTKPNK